MSGMTEDLSPQRRLPEDGQFRAVVIGCCVAAALFTIAFVVITVVVAGRNLGLVDSGWYQAWGGWAGGAATAAAFLIAAFSIRVSSAHAHADRADAARIREDKDMAQARLLLISKVTIPNVPQSLVRFQIENRSQDVFFDVNVPFVDCPRDTGEGMERRTPENVEADNRLHEYIPQGELLVPFRQRTEQEAWFTLVTVHTADWRKVKFAVDYTDASGQRWKQHLGGRIERVLTTDAVPVRAADRFQPTPQIQLLSPEESRKLGGRFARGLPEDKEADLAEIRAIGPFLVATWKGVRRVGTPKASPVKSEPDTIRLVVDYAPTAPNPWGVYFRSRIISDFGSYMGHSGGGSNVAGVGVKVPEGDLEDAVTKIDQAIEYANEQFEKNEMAEIRAVVAQDAADAKAASDHQARLDERTAKLARPDLPREAANYRQRGAPTPRARTDAGRQSPRQPGDDENSAPIDSQ